MAAASRPDVPWTSAKVPVVLVKLTSQTAFVTGAVKPENNMTPQGNSNEHCTDIAPVLEYNSGAKSRNDDCDASSITIHSADECSSGPLASLRAVCYLLIASFGGTFHVAGPFGMFETNTGWFVCGVNIMTWGLAGGGFTAPQQRVIWFYSHNFSHVFSVNFFSLRISSAQRRFQETLQPSHRKAISQ